MVVCVAAYLKKKTYFFDLREGAKEFAEFLSDKTDCILAAYSLNAEIKSLLRIGIDVRPFECIDLLAESRMVMLSHKDYMAPKYDLLTAVEKLLGKKGDRKEKDLMRDLIINNLWWSEEEWIRIEAYCISDVADLEELFLKIRSIHKESGFPYRVAHAIKRGITQRKACEMDFASKGFPVGPEFEAIYENKERIRKATVEALPYYWRNCYRLKKDGKYSLTKKSVAEVVRKAGWKGWQVTKKSGALKMDKDYLKTLATQIPEVEPLRQCIKTLGVLNGKDLRDEYLRDGYVQTETYMFCALTGRNGLYPTRGYMFNLPPWIRKTVCPKEGKVIIGADFSQQEIAIAAKLSGDQNLIDVYNSGDVYLALGKQAGSIPKNGTKATHKRERALYKILQLGLSYGKGLPSLTNDVRGLMGKEWGEAKIRIEAKAIYTWHKQHFHVYWAWIAEQMKIARQRGWIKTSDNWMRYVDRRTRDTQLLNYPSQSEGAVMLRIASNMFYSLWQKGVCPPLLVTQHDAAYMNSDACDVTVQSSIFEIVMREASIENIGLEVRSDIDVYNHEKGYQPEKWDEINEKLWVVLQEIASKPAVCDEFN